MNIVRLFATVGAASALVALLAARAADLGQPAPALKIQEWVKGKAVDLAAGKGKNIYVVEFWATWCGPCRASIPHLTELQKSYADKGVVFVGVSDESATKVKPFVEQMGAKMDYVVAVDPSRQTHKGYMEAFGVRGIPHAFVVDKSGVIAWHGHPMAGLETVLEDLVAGKFDLEAARRAAQAEKQSDEYLNRARAGEDADKLKELGKRVVTDAAGNPGLLNEFAWAILTDRRVKSRDLELATKAAKVAYEKTHGKDPGVTDTYARALFDTGDKAGAVRLQKEAVAACKDESMRQQLEATLKEYQAK